MSYLKIKKSVLVDFLEKDSNTLRVYLYLLNLEKKEIYTTIKKIADALSLSRQNIKTSLVKLQSNNLLNYKKSKNMLEISIIDSVKKQNTKQHTKQQSNNLSNDLFNEFWDCYPKKQAKAKAKEIFDKINVDADLLNEMIEAINFQSKSEQWKKDEGKYIPLPSTWLNQKRWEDERTNFFTTSNNDLDFINGSIDNDEF